MKKQLILVAMIVFTTVAQSQIDSTDIINGLQTGAGVASAIVSNWIPGVNNEVVTGIVTGIASAIIGLVHRRKSLRKLRKDGVLRDGK